MNESLVILDKFGQPDFEHEIMLGEDILFSQPLNPHALNPRNVFLTGSTGLLGVFLLVEWLKNSEANVVCLIRGRDEEEARQRITGHLKAYGLWSESWSERLIALAGDVSQQDYGLGEKRFIDWAERVDLICHSAGSINMGHPYAKLKAVNVNGVVEALRMASIGSTKPLHFISSIAVFYSDAHPAGKILHETDEPKFDASIKGDYGKSKWVADRLVGRAQDRGLPAVIYRPTRIMGHSETGALNDTSEILPQLIRCCILMGCYPDWDLEVTWVPVDYVSRTVFSLSRKSDVWGKSVHLFNPYPIHWLKLMAYFSRHGYDLKCTTYDQWRREVRNRAGQGMPDREFFAGILLAFTGLHYLFHTRPRFDNGELLKLFSADDFRCPAIDQDMVKSYIGYWQKTGFLPNP